MSSAGLYINLLTACDPPSFAQENANSSLLCTNEFLLESVCEVDFGVEMLCNCTFKTGIFMIPTCDWELLELETTTEHYSTEVVTTENYSNSSFCTENIFLIDNGRLVCENQVCEIVCDPGMIPDSMHNHVVFPAVVDCFNKEVLESVNCVNVDAFCKMDDKLLNDFQSDSFLTMSSRIVKNSVKSENRTVIGGVRPEINKVLHKTIQRLNLCLVLVFVWTRPKFTLVYLCAKRVQSLFENLYEHLCSALIFSKNHDFGYFFKRFSTNYQFYTQF